MLTARSQDAVWRRGTSRLRTWRASRARGLAALPLDGCRVLVLIPDGTRTMPMPFVFEALERELGGRVAALDFLVALGTHPPMDDRQLSALVGRHAE